MHDPAIRRATLSDIPYLYEICLKTANAGKDASTIYNDPYVVGQYYAAPYLIFPSGICFVAEYEYRPQGYIVAAPDTIAFNRWMEEAWLPPLRERYPHPIPPEIIRSEDEQNILTFFHRCLHPTYTDDKPWFKHFPAHLHIDLLPGLQGKGCGRALMNTLCEELARLQVPGVHLGVSIKNQGAIAFYQKVGFSILQEEQWGLVMGKQCP
jgi:ribosomal protein S18 acetylase RimI-like enzyme